MNRIVAERSRVPAIDSRTHRTLDELAKRLITLAPSPMDEGRVVMLCSRLEGKERWLPEVVTVDPVTGFAYDRWHRSRSEGEEKYKEIYREMQVATMEVRIAELIANGQPLSLFGDNLFLDLDLSKENLPAGSRLSLGESAIAEVTAAPHNGCKKFHARFGADALRFVSSKETRHRNLRGIYLRIVEGGEISLGDAVVVMSRP